MYAACRQRPLWWLAPPLLPRWEACHWIFGSRCSPTSSAVTDSLDFQVALLPYKSSSLVQLQFLCHPSFAGGTMGAGQWRQFEFMAAVERKPYNRASPGGKQANRPDGRWKCTPSAACRRRLPRRGRFALHSAFELISISRHSAAKTSPSGGSGAIAPKGGAPGMGVI